MVEYRQPTYVPFDPATAPLNPHALSDEFTAKRPGILNVPGFALLDPKWVVWDPGDVLTFSALDVRRQMLLLRTDGDKQWAGVMQNLPIPTVNGTSTEFALYTRCMFADVEAGAATFQSQAALLLGEDLVGSPDTSFLFSAELTTAVDGGSPPVTVSGQLSSASYSGYDMPGGLLAQGAAPTNLYFRVRIKQLLTGGPTWTTTAVHEVSFDGIGWVPMTAAASGNVPYRQVALAVQSRNNTETAAYFDFFRLELTPQSDSVATIGDAQTFGAV
jgi:hypothetical protein